MNPYVRMILAWDKHVYRCVKNCLMSPTYYIGLNKYRVAHSLDGASQVLAHNGANQKY